MNILDHNSESLEIFLTMDLEWKNSDLGSRMNIPDPFRNKELVVEDRKAKNVALTFFLQSCLLLPEKKKIRVCFTILACIISMQRRGAMGSVFWKNMSIKILKLPLRLQI
jgi:hypothetical protein